MTKEEEEEVGLFSFSIYHQNKDSCAIRVKQKKTEMIISKFPTQGKTLRYRKPPTPSSSSSSNGIKEMA
jgi:hypothetical protein